MEAILMRIYEHYTGEDRDMLLRAYDFAKSAHENQKRASGEPYFIHPCAVAEILVELGLNAGTIAAALLHDVIEDTSATAEDIRREFGDEVLSLVEGVTKLDKIVFKSQEEEEAENFRKIFIAMAKDIRVIIIKLADRLHNMRSLNYLSEERQRKMARETLDIYTPIAGRLGQVRTRRSVPEIPRSRRVRIPRREYSSQTRRAQPLRRFRRGRDQRDPHRIGDPRRSVRPSQAFLFHLQKDERKAQDDRADL